MTDAYRQPKAILIGPLPPPAFGVARATQLMVESSILASRLTILHLDTSDPRPLATMGRLDWANVRLGLRHLCRLRQLLVSERPELVLMTASQGTLALLRDLLFARTAHSSGSRVVAYLRGSGYADLRTRRGWLAARTLKSLLEVCSRVIVLSSGMTGMVRSIVSEANVVVVPNGCPPALNASRVAGRQENPLLIAYIGRLSRAKGVHDAVEAAVRMRARLPRSDFVLCGEWDSSAFEAKTRALIEASDLKDYMRFPGPVSGEAKQDLLARASVLVVPSHSEGQPWVILEAMSAGVPVVATDTGAIIETVEDGVTGFVIPVGDAGAMADRVVALLTDNDLWKRSSLAAVRRYRERFTVERSHTALADELCAIARGSRRSLCPKGTGRRQRRGVEEYN